MWASHGLDRFCVRPYSKLGPEFQVTSVSEVLPITHGVPQGAILSPLLFCIYINDLSRVPQASELESFVDDSKIFMSFPIEDIASAKTKIEEDLKLDATWFFENKLLINPDKTN